MDATECLLPPAALELIDWLRMGRELKCMLLANPWMRRSGMLWTVYWCGEAEVPHEVPRLLLREGLIRVATLAKGNVTYELVEQ